MHTIINLDVTHPLTSLSRSISFAFLLLLITGCAAGGDQGPTVSTTASATSATASLAWDPVNDSSVVGYYIHYGKLSPNTSGSCSYDNVQFVSSSQGTISDLDLESTYYFAVSAYNGIEGSCSNEVYTNT